MLDRLSDEDRATLRETAWKDERRMNGMLCFRGTRVPVKNLTDYLKHGHSLEYFLEGFPSVEREQAERFPALSVHVADQLAAKEPRDEKGTEARRQPA